MKTFRKYLKEQAELEEIDEAEYNAAWWDSKSDSFKKRYIERHPNSIYAQKAGVTPNQKKEISKSVDKAFGKNSKAAKTTRDNLDDKPITKKVTTKPLKHTFKDYQWANSEDAEKIEAVRKKAQRMDPHDKISVYSDILDNRWSSKESVQAVADDIANAPDDDPIFSMENQRPDNIDNRYSNWSFLILQFDALMHDPRISKETKAQIDKKLDRIEKQHKKTILDFIKAYDDEKAAKHGGKEYNLLPSDLLKKLWTKYDYSMYRSELNKILTNMGAKGKIEQKRLDNWW